MGRSLTTELDNIRIRVAIGNVIHTPYAEQQPP